MGPISKKKFSSSETGLHLSGCNKEVIGISWGQGVEMSITPEAQDEVKFLEFFKNNPLKMINYNQRDPDGGKIFGVRKIFLINPV
jgi:hypothetical protein